MYFGGKGRRWFVKFMGHTIKKWWRGYRLLKPGRSWLQTEERAMIHLNDQAGVIATSGLLFGFEVFPCLICRWWSLNLMRCSGEAGSVYHAGEAMFGEGSLNGVWGWLTEGWICKNIICWVESNVLSHQRLRRTDHSHLLPLPFLAYPISLDVGHAGSVLNRDLLLIAVAADEREIIC